MITGKRYNVMAAKKTLIQKVKDLEERRRNNEERRDERKNTTCRFFQLNRCNKGNKCRFSHETEEREESYGREYNRSRSRSRDIKIRKLHE